MCYPTDPRIKSGIYHLCCCDYCDKPDYYRDIEQPKSEPEIPDIPEVNRLKYQAEQAKAGYLHLQNKLEEHINKGQNKDKL